MVSDQFHRWRVSLQRVDDLRVSQPSGAKQVDAKADVFTLANGVDLLQQQDDPGFGVLIFHRLGPSQIEQAGTGRGVDRQASTQLSKDGHQVAAEVVTVLAAGFDGDGLAIEECSH